MLSQNWNNKPLVPATGVIGAADGVATTLVNIGNAAGAGFNAFLSGIFHAAGVLFSGIFGTGAIDTGFLNYNNRPPQNVM